MNFGDILNKWENRGPGRKDGEKKPNVMDSWLRSNEVYDKDAEHKETAVSAQEKRRRLKNKKPDAEIDIHGMTRDEAWQKLEIFFNESKTAGCEKILVIHGKGNHSAGEAVLKHIVLKFIEHCPFAGESGRGKAAAGGEGATWVILKDPAKKTD